jgi:hypothetical protein
MSLTLVTIILIGKAIAALAATTAVVTLAVITIAEVKNWFQQRNNLLAADKDNLAFTIAAMLKDGKFKVIENVLDPSSNKYHIVQGIMNSRTGKIKDARAIVAQRASQDFLQQHGNQALALYT